MEETVKKFIEDNNILENAKSLVLAVSGGADSLALAHFMVRNYPQFEYVIAHVNHCLRPEAKAEEKLVGQFARRLGVDFLSVDVDVAAVASQRKQGLEETGRQVRYDFFRGLNRDLILTAHHKDDRAETIIAHILRGSGLRGLRGIMPRDNGVGRPFLCITKSEILAYCAKHNIEYAIDSSNSDTVYTRNKIRCEVMPLLQDINPQIAAALCRLGDIATDDEQALDSLVASFYANEVQRSGNSLLLPNKSAAMVDKGIVRRVVRKIAESMDCPVDFRTADKIIGLNTGKKHYWAQNAVAEQNGTALVFYRGTVQGIGEWSAVLSLGEVTQVPVLQLQVEVKLEDGARPNRNNRAVLDSSTFTGSLTLRNRRRGDWFYLPNGGRKKLSDFLIDEKIPASERDNIPLLAIGSQILWIVGYRQCAPLGSGDISITVKKF